MNGSELRGGILNSTKGSALFHITALTLFVGVVLSFAWTGYISSDDGYYIQAGLGWVHEFPYVGNHIGTARSPVSIPIGLSMWLFGESELAAIGPSCFYLLGALLVTYSALTPRFGAGFAFLTSLFLASIPLFALKSTIPSADLPELFYCTASFWLFVAASEREDRVLRLLISGAMASLAFMSHETAAALLLSYGILFLLGLIMPRRDYFIMAAGFLLMLAVECSYYGVVSGDPLHRYHLTFGAAISDGDRMPVPPLHFDDSGNFHVNRFIDPIIMLLTKQEFCLLFYLVIPAVIWAAIPARCVRRLNGDAKSLAWLLALVGIVWSVFAFVVLMKLKLLPRYYMVPTYFFAVATALWFREMIYPKYPRCTVAILTIAVAVNFIGIAVDNKNPLEGERALIQYLTNSSGPVYVDPLTGHRAGYLCRFAHQDCKRIIAGPPVAGGVFFHNPKNVIGPNRFIKTPADAVPYTPRPEWQQVWSKTASVKLFARLPFIEAFRLVIPAPIFSKLVNSGPGVNVYRLPGV